MQRTDGLKGYPTFEDGNKTIGKCYFLASGLAVPFFLSCFGFIPFLSFFVLLLPFPMVFFLYLEAKTNCERSVLNIAEF